MPDDARYLDAEIVAEAPTISGGAGFAGVAGVVTLPQGQAEYVWVLGVVYDQDGQVLGLRRWESGLSPAVASSLPFSFRVYAMQGDIAEMKLFVEAHANIP